MNMKKMRKITDDCLTEMYRISNPPVDFSIVKDAFMYNDIDQLQERSTIDEKKYLELANRYRKMIPDRFYRIFVHNLLMYRPKIKGENGDTY